MEAETLDLCFARFPRLRHLTLDAPNVLRPPFDFKKSFPPLRTIHLKQCSAFHPDFFGELRAQLQQSRVWDTLQTLEIEGWPGVEKSELEGFESEGKLRLTP